MAIITVRYHENNRWKEKTKTKTERNRGDASYSESVRTK